MKIIILSFLVAILNLSQVDAQILDSTKEFIAHPVCSKNPTLGGCPAKFPANALGHLFDKEIKKIIKVSANPSFNELAIIQRSAEHGDDGDAVTKFQTIDHDFNIWTSKDNNIIKFQQGSAQAGCVYTYDIKTIKGVRYCNAEAPKVSAKVTDEEKACLKTWATDPIKNPRRAQKSCEVFLNAMQSCSKNGSSYTKCNADMFSLVDKKDGMKPNVNPYNKAMPAVDATSGAQ